MKEKKMLSYDEQRQFIMRKEGKDVVFDYPITDNGEHVEGALRESKRVQGKIVEVWRLKGTLIKRFVFKHPER